VKADAAKTVVQAQDVRNNVRDDGAFFRTCGPSPPGGGRITRISGDVCAITSNLLAAASHAPSKSAAKAPGKKIKASDGSSSAKKKTAKTTTKADPKASSSKHKKPSKKVELLRVKKLAKKDKEITTARAKRRETTKTEASALRDAAVAGTGNVVGGSEFDRITAAAASAGWNPTSGTCSLVLHHSFV
jgi:hypothetical protein